jgi:hypothetical protein
MLRTLRVSVLVAPLALAACAVTPTAPTVMAVPRQGDNFAQFQAQDGSCRAYAGSQFGNGAAAQQVNNNAVGSAVVGTALGAAAGAAIGSVGGAAGAGAAIGGATGLAMGSAAGANSTAISSGGMQYQYDMAYAQCMVAAGYTVQQPSYPPPAYAYAPYPYAPYAYAPTPYPYAYAPPVVVGGWGWGGGWGRGPGWGWGPGPYRRW